MKMFVRCDRCRKEAAPVWRVGSGGQIANYADGRYVHPDGWNIVVGYTLCGDCVNYVVAVVHKEIGSQAP